jgi:TolA-binding protein
MPTAPPVSTQDPALEAHVLWWKYRTELIAALLILALALAGFGGYRLFKERRASTAADALARAKNIPDYQQVIDQYGDTPAGATACILMAEAQRNEKKFAEANTTLHTFVDKHPTNDFVPTAEMAVAANLESMGKPDEALAQYQQVAAKYPKNFNAGLALISEVTLLVAKNRDDEARRVCERIMTDYRESFWARQAAQELRSLKPAAEPAPAPNPGIPPSLAAPAPAAAPAGPPGPGPSRTGITAPPGMPRSNALPPGVPQPNAVPPGPSSPRRVFDRTGSVPKPSAPPPN